MIRPAFPACPPTDKQRRRRRRALGRERATRRGLYPAKDDAAVWIEYRARSIERLLRSDHWITFAEVAEWLGRDPGTIDTLPERLASASQTLIGAFRNGSMNPNGHAIGMLVSAEAGGILSIKSDPGVIDAMSAHDNNSHRETILWPVYFERAWMPVNQCVAWFKRNGWDLKPAWESGEPSSWQPRRDRGGAMGKNGAIAKWVTGAIASEVANSVGCRPVALPPVCSDENIKRLSQRAH